MSSQLSQDVGVHNFCRGSLLSQGVTTFVRDCYFRRGSLLLQGVATFVGGRYFRRGPTFVGGRYEIQCSSGLTLAINCENWKRRLSLHTVLRVYLRGKTVNTCALCCSFVSSSIVSGGIIVFLCFIFYDVTDAV